MRVLVTGGAGFLGSEVVVQLRADGHLVFVPRSDHYDLRTSHGIRRALSDGAPEVVVHLAAAVGGIGANAAEPGRFFYDNAIMGLQLMEQAREAGVAKFVTIGTACSYPRDAPIPLREETLWDGYPAEPTAAYGLAKRMLLAQGQAYRSQYGFNAIHVIPTNLYGPGDNFDAGTGHVIPGLIRRIGQARKAGENAVVCWGTGMATRDFLHVTDAARGIALALERYDEAMPVNLGTGVETEVAEVAEVIALIYSYGGAITWDDTRPDGTPRRCMDVTRARSFGFEATTGLLDGLTETIESYEVAA